VVPDKNLEDFLKLMPTIFKIGAALVFDRKWIVKLLYKKQQHIMELKDVKLYFWHSRNANNAISFFF